MTDTPHTDPLGRRPGDIATAKEIGTEWRIDAVRDDPWAPGATQYLAQRIDRDTPAEWIDAQHFETPSPPAHDKAPGPLISEQTGGLRRLRGDQLAEVRGDQLAEVRGDPLQHLAEHVRVDHTRAQQVAETIGAFGC
ncbi:hypothetical protein [Microbacterium sp. A93]|uniref:hypothetical protein n=1 Tax=Microbacterium sp. A93 TaxID=3450716 RepID=UPI003F41E7C7